MSNQNGDQHNGSSSDADHQQRQSAAVAVIQSRYRGHKSKREAAGLNLETSNASKRQPQAGGQQDSHQNDQSQGQDPADPSPISPDTRFNDLISSGGLKNANKEQMEGQNDAASRWKRTGFYAEQITGTHGGQEKGEEYKDSGTENASTREKVAAIAPSKQMEAQYWLEIVDSKHRYGANLKSYHEAWNKADTKENFFYWLDQGEGRSMDLEACSREQLDKERIMYLNAEQRKNYLVDIGDDGLLYWHRNGRRLDTAKNRWEDLGGGRGIGYKGEKDNLPPSPPPEGDSSSSSSPNSSLYSSDDSNAAPAAYKSQHYHEKPDKEDQSTRKYLTSRKALMDVLLRRTIGANTWIFVMTAKHELYVGIKSTGGFQHSSFMYGATVAAAGLIKAKNGQLSNLNPLSGHYRAGTEHFKALCDTLEKEGVDMSRVSIGKSLIVIGGIEKYGKFSKKKKSGIKRMREKLHLPASKEQKKQAEQEEKDKKIEEKAREDHDKSMNNGHGDAKNGHKEVDSNLHEGMRVEDMTEEQRAERAVALIQKAFRRGLKGKEKEVEKAGEVSDKQQEQAQPGGQGGGKPNGDRRE